MCPQGTSTMELSLSLSLSLCQLILLQDVASQTFLCYSSMSYFHLLAGLPFPLWPSIFASRICFSSDLWCFMCPKYTSLSFLMFCKSIGALIPILDRTVSFDIFSVHDILKSFLQHITSKAVIFLLSVLLIVHAMDTISINMLLSSCNIGNILG